MTKDPAEMAAQHAENAKAIQELFANNKIGYEFAVVMLLSMVVGATCAIAVLLSSDEKWTRKGT